MNVQPRGIQPRTSGFNGLSYQSFGANNACLWYQISIGTIYKFTLRKKNPLATGIPMLVLRNLCHIIQKQWCLHWNVVLLADSIGWVLLRLSYSPSIIPSIFLRFATSFHKLLSYFSPSLFCCMAAQFPFSFFFLSLVPWNQFILSNVLVMLTTQLFNAILYTFDGRRNTPDSPLSMLVTSAHLARSHTTECIIVGDYGGTQGHATTNFRYR